MTKHREVMRDAVFTAIDEERAYQDRRWGPKNDKKNSLGDFLNYIHTYWDEASYRRTQGDDENVRHALRKIAALATAALETHGVRTRLQEESGKQPNVETAMLSFNDTLRSAMAGPQVDRSHPSNAAYSGEPAVFDPFNEFLKGATVAQAADVGEDERIYPDANAVVENELSGLPEELRKILTGIFGKMPPGSSMKVVFSRNGL